MSGADDGPSPAYADDIEESLPEELAANGPWDMIYAADSCAPSRRFGEGDKQVIASFVRYYPTSRFYLNLISNRLTSMKRQDDITLNFNGDSSDR